MKYDAIRYQAIARISGPILTSLVRRNMARAAALLIRLHVETQQRATGPEPVNIVYLPKAGHTEDIMACFQGHDRYGIHTLDRKLVKAVFNAFLPVEMDDNNYPSNDPVIECSKKELRAFWIRVLEYLHQSMEFDVVFTGNYSYAAEQELAGALTQMGIPFVALHKECMKTPGLRPFYKNIYQTRKAPFQGVKICVYNQSEAGIQAESGVVEQKNIAITGMPRMDRLHRLRKKWAKKGRKGLQPTVLFFSFNHKAGLPVLGRKLPGAYENLQHDLEHLNVVGLAETCHHAMVRLARENPDLRVVIKTKGDKNAAQYLSSIFGENPDFPSNLDIMAGGDLIDILLMAGVVCSFNSTTLLEALALGKPVVVPDFMEAKNPELELYLIYMEDAVEYASDVDALVRILYEKALEGKKKMGEDLPETSLRLLDKWVGNSDGRAGSRVRRIIDGLIKRQPKTSRLR